MTIVRNLIWPTVILMQFYIYSEDIELTLRAVDLVVVSFLYGFIAGWEWIYCRLGEEK